MSVLLFALFRSSSTLRISVTADRRTRGRSTDVLRPSGMVQISTDLHNIPKGDASLVASVKCRGYSLLGYCFLWLNTWRLSPSLPVLLGTQYSHARTTQKNGVAMDLATLRN